jgi:hypothetical protein
LKRAGTKKNIFVTLIGERAGRKVSQYRKIILPFFLLPDFNTVPHGKMGQRHKQELFETAETIIVFSGFFSFPGKM